MILENGMIRDEHFKTIKYEHKLVVPREERDDYCNPKDSNPDTPQRRLRKRLAENGWTEVDNTCVMDAHETWTKGTYDRKLTCTFPGCWTRTKEGWDHVWFELEIRVKTGYTDYTREQWDARWKDRKEKGYLVVDTYKFKNAPKYTWNNTDFKRYNVLDRSNERLKQSIGENNEFLD